MALPLAEKTLYAIPKTKLIEDGSQDGILKINDVREFVVGQTIIIVSDTQESCNLTIKRTLGKNTIIVGPLGKSIYDRTDVSKYTINDNATIEALEQSRPLTPEQEIERITYDAGPRVARRVHTVDDYGYSTNSPESSVYTNEPITCFIYGTALEVIRIVEYAPDTKVGETLKETYFRYGSALEVTCIWTKHRPATAKDLILTS